MTREEKEQWDIFMSIWVIPALKNTWNEKKCKEIVEALEEWEEQEPWIPASERLPEDEQIVLITQSYGWKEFEEEIEVTIAQYHRKHLWYRYERDWDRHTSIMRRHGNEDVIAWMPLPAPYEPQERSGEE